MPAKRREFQIGERIGHGLTVTSTERVPMRTATGIPYLGIQVRCHCGKGFTVSITNIKTVLGCGCSRGKNRVNSSDAAARRKRIRNMEPLVQEFLQAIRTDPMYIEEFARAYWLMQEDDGGLRDYLGSRKKVEDRRQLWALQLARRAS